MAVVDFGNLNIAGEYTLPAKIVVSGYDNVSAKGNYQVNVKLISTGIDEGERENT